MGYEMDNRSYSSLPLFPDGRRFFRDVLTAIIDCKLSNAQAAQALRAHADYLDPQTKGQPEVKELRGKQKFPEDTVSNRATQVPVPAARWDVSFFWKLPSDSDYACMLNLFSPSGSLTKTICYHANDRVGDIRAAVMDHLAGVEK